MDKKIEQKVHEMKNKIPKQIYFHAFVFMLFGVSLSMDVFALDFQNTDQDLKQKVSLIQKRYQSISSFSGKFIQTSFRNDEDASAIVAEGRVSFLRPGKMRWEYQTPEEQLLVTDGETVWLYDPLLENVTVQKLSKITEVTALDFLLGVGDLNQDFIPRTLSRELLKSHLGIVVELEPREKLANLDFIQIEVHQENHHLKTLLLMDHLGNYRTIVLKSMEYNLDLEENLFQFNIPEGMEVLKAE